MGDLKLSREVVSKVRFGKLTPQPPLRRLDQGDLHREYDREQRAAVTKARY
jgi:hypothetical protein